MPSSRLKHKVESHFFPLCQVWGTAKRYSEQQLIRCLMKAPTIARYDVKKKSVEAKSTSFSLSRWKGREGKGSQLRRWSGKRPRWRGQARKSTLYRTHWSLIGPLESHDSYWTTTTTSQLSLMMPEHSRHPFHPLINCNCGPQIGLPAEDLPLVLSISLQAIKISSPEANGCFGGRTLGHYFLLRFLPSLESTPPPKKKFQVIPNLELVIWGAWV